MKIVSQAQFKHFVDNKEAFKIMGIDVDELTKNVDINNLPERVGKKKSEVKENGKSDN